MIRLGCVFVTMRRHVCEVKGYFLPIKERRKPPSGYLIHIFVHYKKTPQNTPTEYCWQNSQENYIQHFPITIFLAFSITCRSCLVWRSLKQITCFCSSANSTNRSNFILCFYFKSMDNNDFWTARKLAQQTKSLVVILFLVIWRDAKLLIHSEASGQHKWPRSASGQCQQCQRIQNHMTPLISSDSNFCFSVSCGYCLYCGSMCGPPLALTHR